MRMSLLLAGGFALLSTTVFAADPATATANLVDPSGKSIGTATLTQLAHGVLVKANLTGLPPGAHGIHLHAAGKCEPGSPAFASAAGHFNPESHKHGYDAPDGHHAGDLPNILAAADGTASYEAVAPGVMLTGGSSPLIGKDGAALVVHAKADDYKTDPSGASGDRIACGVVKGS